MFWYGYPLITQGAGRIKTDPLNQKPMGKLQQAIIIPIQYKHQPTQQKCYFFPSCWLQWVLASLTFVHPNSKYIGKIFTLFTTSLGWGVHLHYSQTYQASRRFGNYAAYPQDIRRMIDNNDSRYAFRWLKDQYLNISASSPRPQTTGNAATEDATTEDAATEE